MVPLRGLYNYAGHLIEEKKWKKYFTLFVTPESTEKLKEGTAKEYDIKLM